MIIDCGGFNVELAHFQLAQFQQDRAWVAVEDQLSPGDDVGDFGNSGTTVEPHLHVHAIGPERRA